MLAANGGINDLHYKLIDDNDYENLGTASMQDGCEVLRINAAVDSECLEILIKQFGARLLVFALSGRTSPDFRASMRSFIEGFMGVVVPEPSEAEMTNWNGVFFFCDPQAGSPISGLTSLRSLERGQRLSCCTRRHDHGLSIPEWVAGSKSRVFPGNVGVAHPVA